MENRYYVKVRWSPESKQPTRDVSFMVEADSADQIREAIDLKHEIVIIDTSEIRAADGSLTCCSIFY